MKLLETTLPINIIVVAELDVVLAELEGDFGVPPELTSLVGDEFRTVAFSVGDGKFVFTKLLLELVRGQLGFVGLVVVQEPIVAIGEGTELSRHFVVVVVVDCE